MRVLFRFGVSVLDRGILFRRTVLAGFSSRRTLYAGVAFHAAPFQLDWAAVPASASDASDATKGCGRSRLQIIKSYIRLTFFACSQPGLRPILFLLFVCQLVGCLFVCLSLVAIGNTPYSCTSMDSNLVIRFFTYKHSSGKQMLRPVRNS